MPNASMKPLGRNRRVLALLIIAIGVYSFFTTMVVVEPPIVNLARWSALDITLRVYDGRLPAPGGGFDEGLLEIAFIYVLMMLAVAALCVPGRPRALLVISSIGFVPSLLAKFWDGTFHRLFGYYGHIQQWHMTRGLTWWVLPWIMPALLAICFAEALDEPNAHSPVD